MSLQYTRGYDFCMLFPSFFPALADKRGVRKVLYLAGLSLLMHRAGYIVRITENAFFLDSYFRGTPLVMGSEGLTICYAQNNRHR